MYEASNLIERCLAEARRVLLENLTSSGIMAAGRGERADRRRYTRIFGRDHAICALGMALSGDERLIEGAQRGLIALAERQAENGQIPKYIDPESGEVDFWYVGCIDAALWWLIALRFVDARTTDIRLARRLEGNVARALAWLRCQEHQRFRLLQQNEASDWADIMPRSGFVLYTNALWYHVKRLYALPHANETRYHFNQLFFPFTGEVPDDRRARLLTHYVRNKAERWDLYLSFVNFASFGDEGDVFGNILALLFGLADEGRRGHIVSALRTSQSEASYPVRVVRNPIREDSTLWRPYMARHRQNLPHQYHNGGIWPFVGGFWVALLAATGKQREAREELVRFAAACAAREWEFNEWFHGETGEPMGMPRQSWNAAMFIAAYHALEGRVF